MNFKKYLTAAILSFSCYAAHAQLDTNWVKDYQPFRIAGNLYYVGTYDLASYLITTPNGHILINTGLAQSVPMLLGHIKALGFKPKDIKILLATHAHFDHVAGMAEMKKLTGAQMMINEGDVQVLADGGNSDYVLGGKGSMFKPLKADRILHETDTIKLGGTSIVQLHHPGHTKGASSFLLDVKDEQRSYRVLIANMPKMLDEVNLAGTPLYPDVAKDFAYTYAAMRKVEFDIWVASHASQFKLHKKHQPGDKYDPMVFSDRKGYDALIDTYEKEYKAKLEKK